MELKYQNIRKSFILLPVLASFFLVPVTGQHNSTQSDCPLGCDCWARRYDSQLIVNCSNSNLTNVPTLPNVQALALQGIVLYIENNCLLELPAVEATEYAAVTQIHAAGNMLSRIEIHQLPLNLTYLDISHNRLTKLDAIVLKFFNESSAIVTLALSNNPWSCNCDSMPFLQFVLAKQTMVIDVEKLYCDDAKDFKKIKNLILSDICQDEQQHKSIIIMVVSILLVVVFIILLVIICLRCSYSTKDSLKLMLDSKVEKIYDAFISYSHKDSLFIAEHLVRELEYGPNAYKLCIYERDFTVGECIADQIVRSIQQSKRIILVLSANYIESIWARMEFRTAYEIALNDKSTRILAIIYGDIGDIETLDPVLKVFLKSITYVKWGDSWFWEKLRYAMPQQPNLANYPLELRQRREKLQDKAIEDQDSSEDDNEEAENCNCQSIKKQYNDNSAPIKNMESDIIELQNEIKEIKTLIELQANSMARCNEELHKEMVQALAYINQTTMLLMSQVKEVEKNKNFKKNMRFAVMEQDVQKL